MKMSNLQILGPFVFIGISMYLFYERPQGQTYPWAFVFPTERRNALSEQPFIPMSLAVNKDESFDYKSAMKELNDAKVKFDDPRLVKLIRDYYIVQPSTEPYNLDFPDRLEYSNGQTPFVDSRLNYVEGGFYVECGALTGEKGSNSLFFEKVRKWNGILIEADPTNFAVLRKKNRKAFSINACLTTETYPSVLTFKKGFNLGKIVHGHDGKVFKQNEVQIQCFPLYSILLALNQTTVYFFSLDVEGDELNILKNIPFDKVNIKMITVEYIHERGGPGPLKQFMKTKGYDALVQINNDGWGVNDIIFGKKGIKQI